MLYSHGVRNRVHCFVYLACAHHMSFRRTETENVLKGEPTFEMKTCTSLGLKVVTTDELEPEACSFIDFWVLCSVKLYIPSHFGMTSWLTPLFGRETCTRLAPLPQEKTTNHACGAAAVNETAELIQLSISATKLAQNSNTPSKSWYHSDNIISRNYFSVSA